MTVVIPARTADASSDARAAPVAARAADNRFVEEARRWLPNADATVDVGRCGVPRPAADRRRRAAGARPGRGRQRRHAGVPGAHARPALDGGDGRRRRGRPHVNPRAAPRRGPHGRDDAEPRRIRAGRALARERGDGRPPRDRAVRARRGGVAHRGAAGRRRRLPRQAVLRARADRARAGARLARPAPPQAARARRARRGARPRTPPAPRTSSWPCWATSCETPCRPS